MAPVGAVADNSAHLEPCLPLTRPSHPCRRTYRRNIAGFCRKGQRLGADTYDNFQHTLRHHLIPFPILGRNDNLSWHDPADGGLVNGHMDKESLILIFNRSIGKADR